jgi:dihydroflavonol-4-reductase
MLLTHVTGTRLICSLALEMSVERMVVCSSSITLPYGPRAAPARETDSNAFELEGVSYRAELRAYYEAKRAQERVVRDFVARGLHAVLVHPDFVLGPYDVKPTSGAIILQMARAPWIPFYPPGGKSFIGARDCADGHIRALERGRAGESYLLGDHNLSFQEVMSMIARVVKRPAPVWPLPELLRRTGGYMDRHFGARFGAVSQLAAYLDSLYLARYRSAERAREQLGLGSTPLEESIEAAYRWFRDQRMV